MTLRQYLIFMSVGTALCWAAWTFVLFSFNPSEAGYVPFVFFYGSLFLAVVGTFSVIGFMVRSLIVRDETVVFRHVRKTFRQSIFLAFGIVAGLMLSAKQWLTWWNALILIFLIVGFEAILFTNRKYRNATYVQ